MPDAGMALERSVFQSRFEIFQLAFGTAPLEMIAFQCRNACGIVAAIFEALERVDQLLGDRRASENTDDAAHSVCYPPDREAGPLLAKFSRAKILNNYCGSLQSNNIKSFPPYS
jgi:hypothetical protein